MSDVKTFPCGACGGQLEFDIANQGLACPHCGTAQAIAPAGPAPEERDFRSAIEALAEQKRDAAEPVAGELEITCASCGGRTTFTGSLTATRCPYCATPIQRTDVHDAPARLAVDGVVPFKVSEAKAREAVEQWVNGRWFAPSEFKKYKQTGSFQSVYASYFTFDARTETVYAGERGEHYTVTVGSGDDERTETRTRWWPASGTVVNSFDDVCVLANEGFDRAKIQELEPWPTADAVPYSGEYVAGHLCRTYDREVDVCFTDAQERMEAEIEDAVERDIGGDQQRVHHQDTDWSSISFKHLLLPLWLLTVVYDGKPFQVFINGTNGEVQGERPWSKPKIAMAVVAAVLVALVLLALFAG